MEIIIHRGTHQIGGCATEVRTKNTRILIDFGAELPDATGYLPPDDLTIDGLNCGTPDFDGVLLTHYHGDHLGLIAQIPDDTPIYLGRNAIAVHQIYVRRLGSNAPENMRKAAERLRPLDTLSSFTIGDITVTPLPADHSAWDALMFLIKAEGRRILHTGDFRLHGFRGKNTLQLLSRYAAGADVLVIEGSNSPGAGMRPFRRGLFKRKSEMRLRVTNMFSPCVPQRILTGWHPFTTPRHGEDISCATAIRRIFWKLFRRVQRHHTISFRKR